MIWRYLRTVPRMVFTLFEELTVKQCCGSGMFFPDPDSFQPGSATQNWQNNSVFLTQKIVIKKLSEIWSGRLGTVLIPDLGSRVRIFFHPGSRGQKTPGSRICNLFRHLVFKKFQFLWPQFWTSLKYILTSGLQCRYWNYPYTNFVTYVQFTQYRQIT